MADERKIWPQAGMDARVAALSDLEFRIWMTYLTTANDLGVMPDRAPVIQGANKALDDRPVKTIRRGMDNIIGVGLWLPFTVDKSGWVWGRKWQNWQGIKWPRKSPYPFPPDLSLASVETRALFDLYVQKHGTATLVVGEDFTSTLKSLDSNSPSRAGARDAHAQNPHPYPNPRPHGVDLREESARETAPSVLDELAAAAADGGPVSPDLPVWGQRGPRPTAIDGDHLRCVVATKAACPRGVCVPVFLGRQWLAQLGGEASAEAHVRAFVSRVLARVPPGPIAEDPLKFWRAAWQAEHVGAANDDQLDRVLRGEGRLR